jgi:DNA-binding MarR family transcriptional regulator
MDHIERIGEQWRRERPDLDVGALELVGRLLRAAELADSRLTAGLAGYGLAPGWFDLMAALRRSGSPFELSPTELMGATLLTSGGITKRLDRLVDAGLVERRPDPTDRRGTRVRLTPRGRRAIDRALGAHVANEEQLLAVLPAADRRALDASLRKLLESLESS